jgi:hypothetical protein
MVYFKTKYPSLGKFWRALEWKITVHFMAFLEYISAILYILGPLGNLMVSWYTFPHFVILYQEKSGNPDGKANEGNIEQLQAIIRLRILSAQFWQRRTEWGNSHTGLLDGIIFIPKMC